MPTRTHRAIRKVAPILDRIEPYAIFLAYIGMGIMAYYAWVHPPKVTHITSEESTVLQGIFLSIGCVVGLWGHLAKRELAEFYGLCAGIGGVFILLCSVIAIIQYEGQANYGMILGLIVVVMGLMFSHLFHLYHEITRDWIHLTPAEIRAIYNTNLEH